MRAIARVLPRVSLRFFVALRSSSRRFVAVESASAQVLFAASLVALVVAQLPAGDGLRFVLTEPLPRVGLSPLALGKTLQKSVGALARRPTLRLRPRGLRS